MTTTAALILGVCLFLMTMAILGFLLLWQSRSSSSPSPTPTSTPEKPASSDDPMLKVMEMMMKMMETMVVGREPTPAPGPPSPTSYPEMPTTFDYDSTPLSPGIEAVLGREEEEDQQVVLLRERAALQARMAELQVEEMRRMERNGSEDSLPGPWSGRPEQSQNPT
jgi:hypothetical protein